MRLQLVLCVFILLGSFLGQAQDSLYTKRQLAQSDIKLLLSYYTQDGDNSAVTGGQGTEELKVYSTQLNYNRAITAQSSLLFDFGIDIISSASTDNIDFNRSSASRKDGHETAAIGYARKSKSGQTELGGKLKFSIESDYLSRGLEIWGNTRTPNLITFGVNFQAFFADLRWGWFNRPYLKPRRLVYPSELRDTTWFDSAHRSSYNLAFSLQRELTPDLALGLYPSIVHQKGLLSTPFHRVYFTDLTKPRVERLPDKKTSAAVGVQLNSLIGDNLVIRSYYQFYLDDYGMRSHTFRVSVPFRATATLSLNPNVRFYHQNSADYFAPFAQHLSTQEYYTSDYDLSRFTSVNVGLNLTFYKSGYQEQMGQWQLPGLTLKYVYYRRSDGLRAHILSTLFSWSRADRF